MSGFIKGEDRHQATLFPERPDDYIAEPLIEAKRPNARRFRRSFTPPESLRGDIRKSAL